MKESDVVVSRGGRGRLHIADEINAGDRADHEHDRETGGEDVPIGVDTDIGVRSASDAKGKER